MIPENQRPKDNLGAGELFALGSLGGMLESADAIFKLLAFGFQAFDFLTVRGGDVHGWIYRR